MDRLCSLLQNNDIVICRGYCRSL